MNKNTRPSETADERDHLQFWDVLSGKDEYSSMEDVMKIQIRAWQKMRKSYTGMGIALDRTVVGNGVLGDAFTGDLDTALQNGLLFVQPDGTHIFYSKNHFDELPDAALFLADMETLTAQKVQAA